MTITKLTVFFYFIDGSCKHFALVLKNTSMKLPAFKVK